MKGFSKGSVLIHFITTWDYRYYFLENRLQEKCDPWRSSSELLSCVKAESRRQSDIKGSNLNLFTTWPALNYFFLFLKMSWDDTEVRIILSSGIKKVCGPDIKNVGVLTALSHFERLRIKDYLYALSYCLSNLHFCQFSRTSFSLLLIFRKIFLLRWFLPWNQNEIITSFSIWQMQITPNRHNLASKQFPS